MNKIKLNVISNNVNDIQSTKKILNIMLYFKNKL